MNVFEQISLAMKARKAANAVRKEITVNHEWSKSFKAAGVDFLVTSAAVLVAYFADPVNLGLALNSLSPEVKGALIPIVSAGLVLLRKYVKHGMPPSAGPDMKSGALVGAFCLFALLPSVAIAHEADGPRPRTICYVEGSGELIEGACDGRWVGGVESEPEAIAQPEPSPTPRRVEIGLYGGMMQFAERGKTDRKDFVSRLTVSIPAPAEATIFARIDMTRTQDVSDAELLLLDVKTFQSIEAFVGGRKPIGAGFSATAFSGVSWDRDNDVEPTDPHLWTAAAGARFDVPSRGYVIAAIGHHGPVGGLAFLGSLVYEINSGASWFGDIAVPLDAERFAKRPYTVKFGISARLKGWKF